MFFCGANVPKFKRGQNAWYVYLTTLLICGGISHETLALAFIKIDHTLGNSVTVYASCEQRCDYIKYIARLCWLSRIALNTLDLDPLPEPPHLRWIVASQRWQDGDFGFPKENEVRANEASSISVLMGLLWVCDREVSCCYRMRYSYYRSLTRRNVASQRKKRAFCSRKKTKFVSTRRSLGMDFFCRLRECDRKVPCSYHIDVWCNYYQGLRRDGGRSTFRSRTQNARTRIPRAASTRRSRATSFAESVAWRGYAMFFLFQIVWWS